MNATAGAADDRGQYKFNSEYETRDSPSKIAIRLIGTSLTEAERLASLPVHLSGNWSYGQILEHLATAIDCAYDGFPMRASWFMRILSLLW